MFPKITDSVQMAVGQSPSGIASLDVLESLRLCDPRTLKTTLSRLNKSGRIIRLKRGAYSTSPMQDPFACAQAAFGGYIGFSSALYIHKLISELPFGISVVTRDVSKTKTIGQYEFRAVALKEKAIGFETRGPYVVSTRAKTLFDCICLPRYAVDFQKMIDAYAASPLSIKERREFDGYVGKFARGNVAKRIKAARDALGGP